MRFGFKHSRQRFSSIASSSKNTKNELRPSDLWWGRGGQDCAAVDNKQLDNKAVPFPEHHNGTDNQRQFKCWWQECRVPRATTLARFCTSGSNSTYFLQAPQRACRSDDSDRRFHCLIPQLTFGNLNGTVLVTLSSCTLSKNCSCWNWRTIFGGDLACAHAAFCKITQTPCCKQRPRSPSEEQKYKS